MNELILAAAWVLDALAGDPEFLPHPVRAIGRLVTALERFTRKNIASPRWAGIVTGIAVPLAAFVCTLAIILAALLIDFRLGIAVSVICMYTTLSTRSLGQEARAVLRRLEAGDIAGARKHLGRIVGRDTAGLSETEIIRATIETVGENTVDGIVSPLFWGFLGGAPLAMAFKAVSTLDSMVGYKNERYRGQLYSGAAVPARHPARVTCAHAGKGVYHRAHHAARRRQKPEPQRGTAGSGVRGGARRAARRALPLPGRCPREAGAWRQRKRTDAGGYCKKHTAHVADVRCGACACVQLLFFPVNNKPQSLL
jgi:cobalamin biosynthesis protein CobD